MPGINLLLLAIQLLPWTWPVNETTILDICQEYHQCSEVTVSFCHVSFNVNSRRNVMTIKIKIGWNIITYKGLIYQPTHGHKYSLTSDQIKEMPKPRRAHTYKLCHASLQYMHAAKVSGQQMRPQPWTSAKNTTNL